MEGMGVLYEGCKAHIQVIVVFSLLLKATAEKQVPPPSCRGLLREPISPIGSLSRQESLYVTSAHDDTEFACCRRGRIDKWLVITTQDHTVGALGATCTDGHFLGQMTPILDQAGPLEQFFDKTCRTVWDKVVTLDNPQDGNFSYRATTVLNDFLGAGSYHRGSLEYFSCPEGRVSVGFQGSPSCQGLMNFRILCGFASSVGSSDSSAQSGLYRMMGDKAILAFVGVMLILVVLSLDFLFILIRQYKRYKVRTTNRRLEELEGIEITETTPLQNSDNHDTLEQNASPDAHENL